MKQYTYRNYKVENDKIESTQDTFMIIEIHDGS